MATYQVQVEVMNGQKLHADPVDLNDRQAELAGEALSDAMANGRPVKVVRGTITAYVPVASIAFVAVVQLPNNAGA